MVLFRYLLVWFNAFLFLVFVIGVSTMPSMMPARPEEPVPVGLAIFVVLALLANVVGSLDSAFGGDR